MTINFTPADIAGFLRDIRPRRSEVELQDAIMTKLSAHGVDAVREKKLDARNRLDFYIETPAARMAIETKVGRASGPDTERQLLRYALTDRLDHIILVVTRAFPFSAEPFMVDGRPIPVTVVNLEMNFL